MNAIQDGIKGYLLTCLSVHMAILRVDWLHQLAEYKPMTCLWQVLTGIVVLNVVVSQQLWRLHDTVSVTKDQSEESLHAQRFSLDACRNLIHTHPLHGGRHYLAQ